MAPLRGELRDTHRGAQIFAHPRLLHAVRACGGDTANSATAIVNPLIIQTLINESGHLHWRRERLKWLHDDVWFDEPASSLYRFAGHGFIEDVWGDFDVDGMSASSLHKECHDELLQARHFYAAWFGISTAIRVTRSTEAETHHFERWTLSAFAAYFAYLAAKSIHEHVLLQENQFAKLFRVAMTVNTGVESTPCICQLYMKSLLVERRVIFDRSFRLQHRRSGLSADNERDKWLREFGAGEQCYANSDSVHIRFGGGQELFHPGDQLTGPNACLPFRILHTLVCGQASLLFENSEKARDYFMSASLMLFLAMDCFDEIAGPAVPTFMDLVAYLTRLPAELQGLFPLPPRRDLDVIEEHLAQLQSEWNQKKDRLQSEACSESFECGRDQRRVSVIGEDAVHLPPMCVSGSGQISLRLLRVGQDPKHVHLLDRSGAWSLIRAQSSLPLGAPFLDSSTRAIVMHVDGTSWGNLGHMIMFLAPYVAAVFHEPYQNGGLLAVLRRRELLRIYLYLPRDGQAALGRRQELPLWLELLSSSSPILFPDVQQPPIPQNSIMSSMKLAEAHMTYCHGAGQLGGKPRLEKEDLDLFVEVVRNHVPWKVNLETLLRRVWGQHDGNGRSADDPIFQIRCRCIRALLVVRGSFGIDARTIVNIDQLKRLVAARYPSDTVSFAVVRMEDFTLQEKVALAGITDVLIGAYGSAMWWGIFMPENSCVLWLLPYGQARASLPNPSWSRRPHLDYGTLRRLWHVTVVGSLPPTGYTGIFSFSDFVEASDMLAFQKLDVFVEPLTFQIALDGAVNYSWSWLGYSGNWWTRF